jgi:3'-phosphoadenosine 5'-phosphosulfate (PAPS) 3'-phosphatase
MKYLKLLFAGLKLIIAMILSPLLLLLFKYWNKAFLVLITALWPHLDILDSENKSYLRRFFFSPKTKWYRPRFLHYIAQSDAGRNPHDHPGSFYTTILKGGYAESTYYPKHVNFRKTGKSCVVKLHRPGATIFNPEGHTHMVELMGPTWTWVKGWIRGKPWHFWILDPIDATKDYAIESNEYGKKGIEVKSWEKWF